MSAIAKALKNTVKVDASIFSGDAFDMSLNPQNGYCDSDQEFADLLSLGETAVSNQCSTKDSVKNAILDAEDMLKNPVPATQPVSSTKENVFVKKALRKQ